MLSWTTRMWECMYYYINLNLCLLNSSKWIFKTMWDFVEWRPFVSKLVDVLFIKVCFDRICGGVKSLLLVFQLPLSLISDFEIWWVSYAYHRHILTRLTTRANIIGIASVIVSNERSLLEINVMYSFLNQVVLENTQVHRHRLILGIIYTIIVQVY